MSIGRYLGQFIERRRAEQELELDPSEFDVREAIADVCDLLGGRAHERGLELAIRVADDVPATVIGDDGRLRQVLTNLVGNALRFTHEGEVVIAAAVHGELLRLEVRDESTASTSPRPSATAVRA